MFDLTIINPTKDPFPIGEGINQECGVYIKRILAYISVGKGSVGDFTSSMLTGSGDYTMEGSPGTWNMEVIQNADGTWGVVASFDGPASPFNILFTASCSQTGTNPNQLTFSDINSDKSVVLTQDDGSIVTDGKIEIRTSTIPTSFYLDAKG